MSEDNSIKKEPHKLYHVSGGLYETKEQHEARLADMEAKKLENLKGIRGILALFAAWAISLPFSLLSGLSHLSQARFATIAIRDLHLPDAFFTVAKTGYYALLPLALFMIYAYLKKKRYYLYLEIINFISRIILLGLILNSLGSISYIYSELTLMLIITIVGSLITIIFFMNSKRAKLTFVE